jgi:gliding motility-associated-like protein
MFLRILFFVSILCFYFTGTFAEVFTVTSNADSGTGTLREALTKAAANGSAEKDYINFNLPDVSEAGRTITLQSQLPFLSSNLVIDGTTQPSNKLGKSDAKIIIQPLNSTNTGSAFILTNVDGFELYGMYIRDFIGDLPFDGAAAIYSKNSKNIKIGAPAKGNVITHNCYIFATTNELSNSGSYQYGVENLTVYSNYFGFEPDGKTYRGNISVINDGFNISGCSGNILIGGNDDTQRNYFGNTFSLIECYSTSSSINHPATFRIINNYINYDIDGKYSPVPNVNTSSVNTITIGLSPTDQNVTLPYQAYILNNKIQAPCGIGIGPVSGEIVFQGNQVIYEPYPNHPSYSTGGLSFNSSERVLIGGEGPGEPNSLYGTEISGYSSKSFLIQRNSIYCENDDRGVWYPYILYYGTQMPLPEVNINKISSTGASGTATPLSKVELFWDDDCSQCQPLTYITTVSTNATGQWSYSGPIQKGIIASATLNGFTSTFTTEAQIVAMLPNYKIIHSSCTAGGNISGITYKNTGGYQWKNEQDEIIGNGSEISDLKPGKYTLTLLNGTCSTTYTYNIFDATPSINETYKQVVQPSCNTKGSIKGLYLNNQDALYDANSRGLYNIYTYKWLDANGNVRSTNLDLIDAEAGVYRLEVTYNNTCTTTYGPIILTNTTGPNITETDKKISPTPCGQATGSITNLTITGTGTLRYSWKNEQDQEVGTSADLTNQPAGKYTLQVIDETNCGPIYSSPFEIAEINGITINDAQKIVIPATCSNPNGSITGIQVQGATNYQWYNSNNQLVGSSANLNGVLPGTYHLVATNTTCFKTSADYTVLQRASTAIYSSTKVLQPATCGENNGIITVIFDRDQPTAVRWENTAQETLGYSTTLDHIADGTYQLFVTDENGCESPYLRYTIDRIQPIQIITNSEILANDQCAQHQGSVKGIKFTGGKAPYTYQWFDATHKIISTQADLLSIAAGTYELQISDATGCPPIVQQYTINNQSESINSPVVSDVQICAPGSALLLVDNATTGYNYRVYDSRTATTSLDEQTTGRLRISAKANRSFYVSQVIGSCESQRSEVHVSVGISGLDIANTFSPNGDGINDLWILKGMENYPAAIVQVFNRYGEKVFESRGYNLPFNGTSSGKPLPAGAYYYIINLKTTCQILSGNLTIVR